MAPNIRKQEREREARHEAAGLTLYDIVSGLEWIVGALCVLVWFYQDWKEIDSKWTGFVFMLVLAVGALTKAVHIFTRPFRLREKVQARCVSVEKRKIYASHRHSTWCYPMYYFNYKGRHYTAVSEDAKSGASVGDCDTIYINPLNPNECAVSVKSERLNAVIWMAAGVFLLGLLYVAYDRVLRWM